MGIIGGFQEYNRELPAHELFFARPSIIYVRPKVLENDRIPIHVISFLEKLYES